MTPFLAAWTRVVPYLEEVLPFKEIPLKDVRLAAYAP